jgi:hypothetical protein
MGLGIHGSPSWTDHRAGRGEPISSDQAVTTAGTVVNRLQLSLGMGRDLSAPVKIERQDARIDICELAPLLGRLK